MYAQNTFYLLIYYENFKSRRILPFNLKMSKIKVLHFDNRLYSFKMDAILFNVFNNFLKPSN